MGECRAKRVTPCCEDVAIVGGEGLANDAIVGGYRFGHSFRVLFPQAGRAFYVRE